MIGDLVLRRREAMGWTQGELAQKTGLRQTYISQVEQGKIAVPRDHNLDALGAALGVTRAEFYRAAGMLDGLAVVEPVVKPVADEDGAFDPRKIVAYVEAHPDPQFRAQLDRLAERITPEGYERICMKIFRAWGNNGYLAMQVAAEFADLDRPAG